MVLAWRRCHHGCFLPDTRDDLLTRLSLQTDDHGYSQRRTSAQRVRRGAVITMQPERPVMTVRGDTHSKLIGYILWIFGFMGAHRFYYGRPISGTIYFFTLGLFLIGWFVDLFLIPGMDADADHRFTPGDKDYNLSWILLTFLGIFGVHRLYLGKWFTAILWFFTGGLFLLGYLYDYWTLNDQISEANRRAT